MSLGFRADTLAYWRLCQTMMDQVGEADYVIIVEHMPENVLSEYWYVLAYAQGGRAYVYTGGTAPLDGIGLADAGVATGTDSDTVRPVKAGAFQKLLQVMNQCQVWEQENEVYLDPKDTWDPGVSPVMVHVFRRSDARRVQFALADPVVTSSAVTKCFNLDELKDPRLVWGEMPEDADRERWKSEEKLFHRSLPGRCILNGALMLVVESMR